MLRRNALPAQTFPGLGVPGINLKYGMLFMAVSVQQFLQQSNSFVPGGDQSVACTEEQCLQELLVGWHLSSTTLRGGPSPHRAPIRTK